MAVRYASIFAKKYGTQVRYIGTLFELAYQTFYMQRAAVNKDSCNRTRRAHSLGYSQVIIIVSYVVVTSVL